MEEKKKKDGNSKERLAERARRYWRSQAFRIKQAAAYMRPECHERRVKASKRFWTYPAYEKRRKELITRRARTLRNKNMELRRQRQATQELNRARNRVDREELKRQNLDLSPDSRSFSEKSSIPEASNTASSTASDPSSQSQDGVLKSPPRMRRTKFPDNPLSVRPIPAIKIPDGSDLSADKRDPFAGAVHGNVTILRSD